MVVVVFLLRSLKHEKECETKTVTRTPYNDFHNRFHLGQFMEIAENVRVLGRFCMKTVLPLRLKSSETFTTNNSKRTLCCSSSGNLFSCSVARHLSVSRLSDHSTSFFSPQSPLFLAGSSLFFGSRIDYHHFLVTASIWSLHFYFPSYLAPVHRCIGIGV